MQENEQPEAQEASHPTFREQLQNRTLYHSAPQVAIREILSEAEKQTADAKYSFSKVLKTDVVDEVIRVLTNKEFALTITEIMRNSSGVSVKISWELAN